MRSAPRSLTALALAALALTACGDNTEDAGSEPAAGGDAPLAELLPQEVRDAGVLRVGSDIAYAPVEFYGEDGRTPTGIDPDLAEELGEQLGVRFAFQNATFDGVITSLRSDRIDLIMSAMSDTPERQQQVDFVDHFKLLKTSSLAYAIQYQELLFSATTISSRNLLVVELLFTVALWYLLLTSVFSVGQYYLERRIARGASRTLPPTPLQRLRALVLGRPRL